MVRTPSAVKPGSLRHLVREALHERGMRCTNVRVLVLEAMAAAGGHLTVSETHQRVEADLPGVELSTVYRTMTTLQDIGLVHRIDVADQPATYGTAHIPHHHAVCTSCGAIAEVPASALAATVDLAQQATGYSLNNNASLQLQGLCSNCQRKGSATPAAGPAVSTPSQHPAVVTALPAGSDGAVGPAVGPGVEVRPG